MRVCRNSTHRVCTFTTYAIGMFRIVYRVEQYSTIVLSDSKCIECAAPERFPCRRYLQRASIPLRYGSTLRQLGLGTPL